METIGNWIIDCTVMVIKSLYRRFVFIVVVRSCEVRELLITP